jgi:hypothetical protein
LIAKVVSAEKVKNVVRDYGSMPNLPEDFEKTFVEVASMLKDHEAGTPLPISQTEEPLPIVVGDYDSDSGDETCGGDDEGRRQLPEDKNQPDGQQAGGVPTCASPGESEDLSTLSLPQLRKKCVELGLTPSSWVSGKLITQIQEATLEK